MPIAGRKPKPLDQKRNRSPVLEWTEVPNVPFTGAPSLPRFPARRRPTEVPEPDRPLGRAGQALWDRAWHDSYVPPDVEPLLLLCEQADERVALRVRVLTDADWHERQALRALDTQITAGLKALGLSTANPHPVAWPEATKRWWKALSRMPHCVLWDETDWQAAVDTALLVAAFHNGTLKHAPEIRVRERLMGTTADARRDLRIRYVDPQTGDETPAAETASVTAMEDYRRMVQP